MLPSQQIFENELTRVQGRFYSLNYFTKEEEIYLLKKLRVGIIGTIALLVSLVVGQATIFAASSHTVKSGDTLWDIARTYEVSVGDLIAANQLSSHLIFPAQELKIEKKNKVYTVKKGDTLSDIADKQNIPLVNLMTWNGISGHLIYPGDELALDGTTNLSSKKAKSSPDTPTANKQVETPKAKTPMPAKESTEQTPPPPAEATEKPNTAEGKEISMTATAYTAYCEGCSGTTSTGIDLRSNPNQKVIAVDPKVIPLGSRVWVEGYGEAIAGDVGGAIKGNIIDVFLQDKQEALNWGRKTVTVKILD